MSDRKIDEATPDTNIGGGEKIPMDDAGAAKFATTGQIKDYVLAQLAASAAADAVALNDDGVYLLKGGVVKPISAATLTGAILDYAFGLVPVSEPNGNEIIPIKDSGTKKTLTLAGLKEWLEDNLSIDADLDVSDLPAASEPLTDTDLLIIARGSTNGKLSISGFKDYVLGKLSNYVGLCAAAQNLSSSDVFYVIQGGTEKKCTLAQLFDAIDAGDVNGPETTTENKIPQWDSATKKLKDGLSLQAAVRAAATAVDTAIPTEKAVRTALDAAGDVKAPGSTTQGKIPQWDSASKTLTDGLSLQTSVRASASASDTAVPSEKSVRTELDAKVEAPSLTTENNIPQWDSTAKKLKDGVSLRTSVRAAASAVDTAVPSEKSVRTELDNKVDAPVSTTQNKIPQWDSTTKKLKDGLDLQTSIRQAASAVDTAIPTEKAVREAIDGLDSRVDGPETTTENNIPQWDSTAKKLKNGLPLQTTVRSAASASDGAIPTEKAVRTLADRFVSMPESHTEDCIPTWGAASELKAGKSVVTVLGSTGSNDNVPTEKAVRDALPVAATQSKAGLMSAADKTKLDGLADTGAVEEIGQNLSDNDTIVVKKGDSVYRKSLLSRFWTYILGKLPSVRIDLFAAAQDNTNANATTDAHGLLPKLDGNTTHFLRGDGAWGEPPGSVDFVGDSGSGGTHGLVPAPASGDAAANKFLNASGAWMVAPSAAGVDIPGSTAIDALTGLDAFYVYDASEGEYRRVSGAQLAAFLNGLTRYETLFVPAGAFAPSTVGGAAMSSLRFTNNTHDVAAFPADEDAFVEFNVQMPDDWNGLPFKAKVQWTCNSADAENDQTAVFTLGAVAFDDGDAITDAPTTPVSISDALLAANELHVSAASAAITPDGDGKFIHFRLGRDVSEGTIMQPVQVLGVTIQYGRTSDAEQW